MRRKCDHKLREPSAAEQTFSDELSGMEVTNSAMQTKPKYLGYLFVERDMQNFPPRNEVKSDLLTSQEAAAYLRCSVKTLYNYKCNGKIKGINIGGTSQGPLRFKKADLDIFLFGKRGA